MIYFFFPLTLLLLELTTGFIPSSRYVDHENASNDDDKLDRCCLCISLWAVGCSLLVTKSLDFQDLPEKVIISFGFLDIFFLCTRSASQLLPNAAPSENSPR